MSDEVSLQPWTADDLPVLQRTNTPRMTAFLGGPETAEKLVERNERYRHGWETGDSAMFTIRLAGEPDAVGTIGYWPATWHDGDVYETGWGVTEPFQGRGVASRALAAVLRHAAEHGDRALILAFPRVDNAASNALCRSAGFVHHGEEDFEYPKGHPIRVNAWAYDLQAVRSPSRGLG
ncbi:GNAT family N-acetyltransferase [Leifsonia poae]|uniref:N-acetyltransferase GCN5 n=1 Tax=Leifsonia poae TaxID=110933 RepID=A0A9W6H6N7_9MICO|nr:GNAT family N-acetyltransferase [Leifsonia poae]GLJ74546.1 N-acetyltransferase GCN5 [Leifsonia poae]